MVTVVIMNYHTSTSSGEIESHAMRQSCISHAHQPIINRLYSLTLCNKKLICRRQAARCFVSLNFAESAKAVQGHSKLHQ